MINSRSVSIFLLIPLLLLVSNPVFPQQEVPVADHFGRWLSKTASVVQKASEFIKKTARPLVKTFQTAQKFFIRAQTVIRTTVSTLRYIERSFLTYLEIQEIFEKSLVALTQEVDKNNDGIDDLNGLDKWKHLQVLLAILGESEGFLEMLQTVLEPDAYQMDDKGRVIVLREVYRDLRDLKRAINAHLRQINREVYGFRRLESEAEVFSNLFLK